MSAEGRRRWRPPLQEAPEPKAGSRAAFPTTLDVQGGETDRTAFFPTELIFFSSQLFRSAQQTLDWILSSRGSTAHAHERHSLATAPRASKGAERRADTDPEDHHHLQGSRRSGSAEGCWCETLLNASANAEEGLHPCSSRSGVGLSEPSVPFGSRIFISPMNLGTVIKYILQNFLFLS